MRKVSTVPLAFHTTVVITEQIFLTKLRFLCFKGPDTLLHSSSLLLPFLLEAAAAHSQKNQSSQHRSQVPYEQQQCWQSAGCLLV